jgi:hypothetical protein
MNQVFREIIVTLRHVVQDRGESLGTKVITEIFNLIPTIGDCGNQSHISLSVLALIFIIVLSWAAG